MEGLLWKEVRGKRLANGQPKNNGTSKRETSKICPRLVAKNTMTGEKKGMGGCCAGGKTLR